MNLNKLEKQRELLLRKQRLKHSQQITLQTKQHKLSDGDINGNSIHSTNNENGTSPVDKELYEQLTERIQIIRINTIGKEEFQIETRKDSSKIIALKHRSVSKIINQPVRINKSFGQEDLDNSESTSLDESSTDSLLIRRELEEIEQTAEIPMIRPAIEEASTMKIQNLEEKERPRSDSKLQTNKIDNFQSNEEKNTKTIASIDPTENLQMFVTSPAPQGVVIRCCITRHKDSIEKGFYPAYFLHLEREDNKKFFLLAAKRRKRSKTSSYLISVDVEDFAKEANTTIGKVKSNFLGTNYTGMVKGEDGQSNEIVAVIFDPNILGFKGPRKMTVVVPKINSDRSKMNRIGIMESWKKGDDKNLLELRNKVPVWNEDTSSYVLNFHGRVTQASVKNFQIVHKNELMQFGRVASDKFTMDYAYPLTTVQAFAIALSSFDGKIACE